MNLSAARVVQLVEVNRRIAVHFRTGDAEGLETNPSSPTPAGLLVKNLVRVHTQPHMFRIAPVQILPPSSVPHT